MCSACGILQGGAEWIDGVGSDGAPHDRMAERRRRMELVNLLLEGSGVTLREHGRQLVVTSATGVTKLTTSLSHVWRYADEIGRSRVDPLALAWASPPRTSE